MDFSTSELKAKILESKMKDKEKMYLYCDLLLQKALAEGVDQEIAAAYLWLADYSYYIKRDMASLDLYLDQAKTHLSMEPSRELIQYYTLKAMNNDATYDLLSRLDSYLEIISNGKKIGDELNIVTANGNIAELFHLCRDYENALAYGITVYEQYIKLLNARDVNKTILITNIVECSCYTGDVDKAFYYIGEMEKIGGTFEHYKIYLNLCYLRYYSVKQMTAKALELEEVLLELLRTVDTSRDTKYECLLIMIEAMLTIKAAKQMEELIVHTESMFQQSDINRWLQIQKMRIEYFTLIGDRDALGKQYQIYVKAYEQVERANQETKIKGLRANIEIQNIRRKEETLLMNNRSLEAVSRIDVLTQLYNRRYFNTFLLKLQQEKKAESFGFGIYDVDYFKEYNDTYGHLKGDEVLVQVAQILKNTRDARITPCRFGGDEFISIFVDMNNQEIEAYILGVMKQLEEVAIPHCTSKCKEIVTLSIGFGMEDIHGELNHSRLLEKIDQALYESKHRGRNTYTAIAKVGG